MPSNGAADLHVQARSALLDALTALWDHRDSVVVIGAQAIYLHTGAAAVALAEATKDSDLALDSRSLGSDPLIEAAMTGANFILNPDPGQPGSWINPSWSTASRHVGACSRGDPRTSVHTCFGCVFLVRSGIGYRVSHPGWRNIMQALAVAGGIAMTGR